MANFPPYKNYILFCLDKLTRANSVRGPFLDVGCGCGDVSLFFAEKGWKGKAIDLSPQAIRNATSTLASYSKVKVELLDCAQEKSQYHSILMMDILEHVENDSQLLRDASKLLVKGGHLIMTIPSNPREWRWDDTFYGHLRRYTQSEITSKLKEAGLQPVVLWDISFPIFWIMRLLYTAIHKAPNENAASALDCTLKSSYRDAWAISKLSKVLSRNKVVWQLLYPFQFLFKKALNQGGEFMILAVKP